MTNEQKPREFWIPASIGGFYDGKGVNFAVPLNGEDVLHGPLPEPGGIKVIEYSAYEAACKERDTLATKLREIDNLIPKGMMFDYVIQERNKARDERDKLRAELEKVSKAREAAWDAKDAETAKLAIAVGTLEKCKNAWQTTVTSGEVFSWICDALEKLSKENPLSLHKESP